MKNKLMTVQVEDMQTNSAMRARKDWRLMQVKARVYATAEAHAKQFKRPFRTCLGEAVKLDAIARKQRKTFSETVVQMATQ